MKYFKNNNEIYAYDEEQISQGYGSDMIEITLEEVNAINQAKEDEYKQTTEYKLSEAKSYLTSTDWYYARKAETGEDVPADVVAKRIEYREFIRGEVNGN